MHTVNAMSYQDFDFELDGQKALLEDIFPGFNVYDRIGVVVREAGGGTGASALLMSALTRFYDFFRPESWCRARASSLFIPSSLSFMSVNSI